MHLCAAWRGLRYICPSGHYLCWHTGTANLRWAQGHLVYRAARASAITCGGPFLGIVFVVVGVKHHPLIREPEVAISSGVRRLSGRNRFFPRGGGGARLGPKCGRCVFLGRPKGKQCKLRIRRPPIARQHCRFTNTVLASLGIASRLQGHPPLPQDGMLVALTALAACAGSAGERRGSFMPARRDGW